MLDITDYNATIDIIRIVEEHTYNKEIETFLITQDGYRFKIIDDKILYEGEFIELSQFIIDYIK